MTAQISTKRLPPHFGPTLFKAFLVGSVFSALCLHVAISIIAPGGAGTSSAIGDGAIFFVILIAVTVVGSLVFPVAAILSWPFRRLTISYPALAAVICSLLGAAFGFLLNFFDLRGGPGDFWSGPTVGVGFAVAWVFVVRRELARFAFDNA
ncbi:hypothetical protein [Qipengyuania sp. MTN3-11]|uniref:hypothetical protein n=1 Tax=Qipengyuania sp. MTN3-11 TaxID=3056557 RepID=UPI0036F209FE